MSTVVVIFVAAITIAISGLNTSDQKKDAGTGPKQALVRGLEPPDSEQIDQYHPERNVPKDGGVLRVHASSDPKTLNYLTNGDDNSVYLIWQELTDRLAYIDWSDRTLSPGMAASWTVEDTIVLREDPEEPPRPSGDSSDSEIDPKLLAVYRKWEEAMSGDDFMSRRIYGRVYREGEDLLVCPDSAENPLQAPRRLKKNDYVRVDPGTAITLRLRKDVTWHDGTPLTAEDLVFTLEAIHNPHVSCDWLRGLFQDVREYRALDPWTVRFVYSKPYFQTLFYVTVALRVLPSHVLRVAPEGYEDRDDWLRAQGEKLNGFNGLPMPNATSSESPAPKGAWIGNGPYRIKQWSPDQFLELERYESYSGKRPHIDTIRYKFIPSRQLAYQALKADEIDFVPRVDPSEFFDDAEDDPIIQREHVRSLYYTPHVTFVAWNNQRTVLKDPIVRRALTLAFDRQRFIDTYSYGMGQVVSGDQYYFGPAYDKTIKPLPYDPGLAEKMLEEAGWYDRDGDGIRDKDGVSFKFTYTYPNSSDASIKLGRELQNAYGRLGIEIDFEPLDFTTLLEKLRTRDYDACPLIWVMDPETDPYQNWHSSGAAEGARTSNYAGYANPEVDALIDIGRKTIDDQERWNIWHQIHAKIHLDHPMMFLSVRPERAIYHRRFRGVAFEGSRPGFRLREWYLVE